ncbi:MAG TPA: alpha/beta fold hydrolase [Thermoleophilaceae bacterium]|nr:alpha/beta fold hydrolase [Thermoleophilaceae bacterium]
MSAGEQVARLDGVEIAYDTIGDPAQPALLLVMGLGMQLIHWPDELCAALAERGFHVIRFDNRDAGRSTHWPGPPPDVMRAAIGRPVNVPYKLTDMAGDAIGLLDHLGVDSAHVAGASMGGMIGQTLAIEHPDRVLSLTSIMSTTGERRVGRPRLRTLGVLLRKAPREREAYAEHMVRVFRAIGSPAYTTDEGRLRELARAAHERGHDSAGVARQLVAIMASGDRTEALRRLDLPVLVIHGAADPLIPARAGRATAGAVPRAELIEVPGMGHDMPLELWPRLIDAIAANAARAVPAQVA